MFSKRFVATFVSLNIVLAVGLLFMKNDYVFNLTRNVNAKQKTTVKETYENYSEVESVYKEKFLILSDDSEGSSMIVENFTKVIEDMDKEIELGNLGDFTGSKGSDYRAIIVTSENLNNYKLLKNLIDYAKDGGNLILAQRPMKSDSLYDYKEDLGIEDIFNYEETNMVKVESNILIKGEGIERTQDVSMHSLDLELAEDTIVHLSAEDELPLLWEKDLEEGKVIVANGQFFTEKVNRGLVSGTISRTGNSYIYPIINSKVFHVDDFPAPIPQGLTDEIFEEYGMDNNEFFHNVWWPDMVRITKKYDTKMTGYLVYNYEDEIEDLENYDSKEYKTHLITQGQNLIKSGGELGLHGFNHQPLRMEAYDKVDLNYKNWKTSADMLSAVGELNNFLNEVYPKYEAKAYVPPSNILSKEGRIALKEAVPTLNVISSLFIGGEDEYAYEQEFGKGEDGIYDFPRYFSGYSLDETSRWYVHNGITNNGVFSHFIHPDDLLDTKRNYGKAWSELSVDFEDFMEYVYDNFEWMRSMTISGGVNALDDYLESETVFSYEDNNIKGYMKNNTKEDYFILRSEEKITSSKGCDFEEIDKGIYLVKATEPEFSLKTGGR